MTYAIDKQERRRSQRIPQSVPLFVRCPDSPFTFGGNLKTIEVSNHGCVIHALRPFPRGTELRLDILQGNRTTTARVVHSDPIGTGMFLGTRPTGKHLDGEAAATRLVAQDLRTETELGGASIGFQ